MELKLDDAMKELLVKHTDMVLRDSKGRKGEKDLFEDFKTNMKAMSRMLSEETELLGMFGAVMAVQSIQDPGLISPAIQGAFCMGVIAALKAQEERAGAKAEDDDITSYLKRQMGDGTPPKE